MHVSLTSLSLSLSLSLSSPLLFRLWWDSPFVASQLDKIGATKAKLLAAQGFDSVEKLKKATSHHFEIILNHKPPMGTNVCFIEQNKKTTTRRKNKKKKKKKKM